MAEEPVDRKIFDINSYPTGRVAGRGGRPRREGVKRTPAGYISRCAEKEFHVVYAISHARSLRTKVGFSSNFKLRHEQVGREVGEKLFVRALISFDTRASARKCEKSVHEGLRAIGRNVKGEWFDISDGDIQSVFHEVAEKFASEVKTFSMAPINGHIRPNATPIVRVIDNLLMPV